MKFTKVISSNASADKDKAEGGVASTSSKTSFSDSSANKPPMSASTSSDASAGGGASRGTSVPASGQNKLSSDVEIKGKVRFKDGLIVDGKIEGEIESGGSLTVQKNAYLKAEIRTRSVVIEGKVHGNIIVSEHARIAQSAEVVGDVKAATLEIESGATFVGKSTVGNPSVAPQQSKPLAKKATA